nr:ABC transporter ATP-binding protein [Kibdelosporangium sp. MJ126-NF4]
MTAEGLGRRYRHRRTRATWALRDCSFEVPAGMVTALVGANGAGKTTLINILAGVLAPSAGQAKINGRVAYVAQQKPLYRPLSVTDMLKMGESLNRVWDQGRAERWLDRFGVPLGQVCGELSGGQQTQVALALAFGACPSVLLLDEPLASLDPLARHEITRELMSEVADNGMTVLLSTHMVADLGGVADHLLLLADGRLRLSGDMDTLLAEHLHVEGPRTTVPPCAGDLVRVEHARNYSAFLMRTSSSVELPQWRTRPVSIGDLVLGYMSARKADRRGEEAA